MAFLDEFLTSFFSAGRKLKVSEQQKAYAVRLAAGRLAEGHDRLHRRLGAHRLPGPTSPTDRPC